MSGWGYQQVNGGSTPDHLMAANVTILTHEDCQNRFSPKYTIYPGMICAGGNSTDACQVTIRFIDSFKGEKLKRKLSFLGRFRRSLGVQKLNGTKCSNRDSKLGHWLRDPQYSWRLH